MIFFVSFLKNRREFLALLLGCSSSCRSRLKSSCLTKSDFLGCRSANMVCCFLGKSDCFKDNFGSFGASWFCSELRFCAFGTSWGSAKEALPRSSLISGVVPVNLASPVRLRSLGSSLLLPSRSSCSSSPQLSLSLPLCSIST